MWKNALICKELLPELSSSNASLDLIVGQLFNKYFRDKVQSELEKDDEQKLCRSLELRSNQASASDEGDGDVWIFGYGSLVWKADFPYIDRRRGFICGYQRRFYQHSIDHRGTHAKPGRVVTLLPTDGEWNDRVYGMAYRIASQQKHEVLRHLDHREKNGYERLELQFHEFPEYTGSTFNIIMYIATHENDSYAGSVWQLPRIADQIFSSAGPSGPNRDYLFNLANSMRLLFPGVNDEHLFELEKLVKQRIETIEKPTLEFALKREIAAILAKEEDQEADALSTSNVQKAIQEIQMLNKCCTNPGWRETLVSREAMLNQYSLQKTANGGADLTI